MSVLSQFTVQHGGALETTGAANITLTASSAKVQSITMTATALSVTLPAANSLKTGGPLYIIKNTGGNPFSLRDSASGILATLFAGQCVALYLTNNSSAAGVWVVGDHTAKAEINPYIPTIVHSSTSTYYKTCGMTATQALLLVAGTSVRTLNATGNSFSLGTELAVSVGNGLYTGLVGLTSTTALYIWSAYVVDKNVLHAAVITVSGTTCTIGTTVVCTEGSGNQGWPGIARLTNTTAVATQGTDAYVITVSGTVPSFGPKQASLTTGVSCSLSTISSTSVLATYNTNRKAFSISGNTITAGSAITRAGNYHSSGALSSSYGITAIGETTGYNMVIEQVQISGTTLTSAGVYAVTGNILPSGGVGAQYSVAPLDSTTALVLGNYTGTATAGSACVLVKMVSGFLRISTPMAVLPEVNNTSYQSIIPLSPTRAMAFIPSPAGLYGTIVDVV